MGGRMHAMRGGAAAGGAVVLLLALAAAAAVQTSYREVPQDFLAVIEAAEQVFEARNAEAIAPYLAEDYSWLQVTPDGAKEMIRGREATVALLKQFYAGDTWIDSDFERLGMVGNILVQVEEDLVREGGKPVKKVTLNIYEFRDGKRWREWKFYPMGEGPAGNMPAAAPAR